MKYAKDLMTKNPKAFQSGESLKEAMDHFVEANVFSCPVVTPMGDVLGLLTEISLVRSSVRFFIDSDRHDKIVHHTELLEKPAFVEEDSPIEAVIRALLKTPTHRVLVMTKQKRLVGIISPKDILRAFTGDHKARVDLREELEKTKEEAQKLNKELVSVKETLQKYQSIFKDTPTMMHGVDDAGKIVMANSKIHEILGYDDGELLGKNISDLYPQSTVHEALAGLDKIKESGHHHAVYTTMVKKTGDKVRVEVISSSLRDQTGKFVSTISASREINSDALLRALHGVTSDSALDPSGATSGGGQST